MQPVDVYIMYCALKAHFGKGDYDYIKYGGKSSATRDSFWKRTDRIFFVKISTVLFERTNPASSIENPAAIHITNAPITKK